MSNIVSNERDRLQRHLSRPTDGSPSATRGSRLWESQKRTYQTWVDMRRRCVNPRVANWPHYGGRGITVCDRWQTFANFFEDMGEKPDGLTLDRIDNDGNYEPSNCRWATPLEQRHNQRPRKKAALPKSCRHGHLYIEGSYQIDHRGARQCLECVRSRKRRRMANGRENGHQAGVRGEAA